MLKYEYVNISVAGFFTIGSKCEEHRKIIDEYALKGYRYVGFVPTRMTENGKYRDIDLIFEIEQ